MLCPTWCILTVHEYIFILENVVPGTDILFTRATPECTQAASSFNAVLVDDCLESIFVVDDPEPEGAAGTVRNILPVDELVERNLHVGTHTNTKTNKQKYTNTYTQRLSSRSGHDLPSGHDSRSREMAA